MELRARTSQFVFMALAAALPSLIACGTPAAPQPPSLYLPQPVTDLAATRNGNEVFLQWTMPKRTTDRVLLKGDQDAHICRSVENGPCETAGDAKFAPNLPARFTDHLPGPLVSGPPRLITYTVELRNRLGRTAGPSNPAYSAAGAAPIAAIAFAGEARADGVLLHWQPVQDSQGSEATFLRLDRTLVPKAAISTRPSSASQRKGIEVPSQQTLEVPFADQHDPARTLDKDAALDNTYTYMAQRIARLTLSGHSIEVASAPSETITVNARDIFPPSVPSGLVTVASPDEHVIDLSWSPNPESDLAGYIVYRRESGSNPTPARISPAQPVPTPSFRDSNARPGTRYAYSISSIDQDGNESARSPEVEETLPGSN
jgi:Fibronectin type III domain